MNLTTTLKASLAVACVVAFAGCTDLKPIQAQIDDLKSQVAKNTSDDQKTASEAAVVAIEILLSTGGTVGSDIWFMCLIDRSVARSYHP